MPLLSARSSWLITKLTESSIDSADTLLDSLTKLRKHPPKRDKSDTFLIFCLVFYKTLLYRQIEEVITVALRDTNGKIF